MNSGNIGWGLRAARMLLVLAILGAGYLAWVAFSHPGAVAGCGGGSGCERVLSSRWAYWLGLPVSVPALLVYLGLLGATVLADRSRSADEERGAWVAIVVLAVGVVGAALWFVGLQAFVIHAFCKICMATHCCGFAAAVLCLANIPVAKDPATPLWSSAPDKRGVPGQAILSLVLMGVIALGVLAGGQAAFPTERNLVTVVPVATNPAPRTSLEHTGRVVLAATNSGAQQATNPPASPDVRRLTAGLLSVYGGQFVLRLDELPMMGSAGASNLIVYLFDYTCPHCRDLHGIMAAAQSKLSNQLGIVTIPMPMSTNCNNFIPANFSSSTNSCDYTRIGLGVWRAAPAAYRQFDDWFFSTKNPPSVAEAAEYARRLVGAEKLQAAQADPWINQQIELACRLHFANWAASGRPAMPQILIGQAISVGQLLSVEHFFILLNRYLGMDTLPAGPR